MPGELHVIRSPMSYPVSLLMGLALFACESDATLPNPDTPGPTGELVVDASSTTAFTWVDLAGMRTVAPSNPVQSTAWDIGIRRYEVRLNGGLTGSAGVDAALLVNHADESPSTILGYSAAERLAEFDAIDAGDIPGDNAFSASALVPDPSSWFTPAGQGLVANPGRVWKFRLASGGHALLRIAELGFTGHALTTFRIEYRLQAVGGALGAIESATVVPGAPGTPARLSLVEGGATDAGGCGWDLSVDAALAVTLNAAASCQAGTFPLEAGVTFDNATSAADAPQYGGFLSALSSPIANSIAAEDSPPFLYGVDASNPHRLVPTYNIYLIRRGSAVYKLQFLGYYNPAGGAAGHPTLRIARIK